MIIPMSWGVGPFSKWDVIIDCGRGPAHTRNSSTEPRNGFALGWGRVPPIAKLKLEEKESGREAPKDPEHCHTELTYKLIDPEIESKVATRWMEVEE
jgi:hypothetical protein